MPTLNAHPCQLAQERTKMLAPIQYCILKIKESVQRTPEEPVENYHRKRMCFTIQQNTARSQPTKRHKSITTKSSS
jgi:hypothetical protein